MEEETENPLLPEPAEPDPLTPKRRALVDAMVWRGLKLTDAAVEAGMTERNARMCAQDPSFRAALNREMAAFKASHRPRNVHRLAELRDQDEAKGAAVQAIRLLEDMAEAADAEKTTTVKPGIVVIIRREHLPQPAAPEGAKIVFCDPEDEAG
ncbi:hypothetical protein EZH22_13990 [Xanthobacter dioxanivorans]|uniref:Terminase small subunit n=1 Tax=Xanthobacter dioxanivorans TaxID=2528964 RepID=A0A974SM48_9HYPH|nr:hypothetical protein [Xanthobacter dioxanivorans]QRG09263.1 hypothetical protein EZH22_13990 [Xanthobacter dioxanivorans]